MSWAPSRSFSFAIGTSLALKENDLEGAQDMGGKHGGQAGMPKPVKRPDPRKTEQSGDVPAKSPSNDEAQRG